MSFNMNGHLLEDWWGNYLCLGWGFTFVSSGWAGIICITYRATGIYIAMSFRLSWMDAYVT